MVARLPLAIDSTSDAETPAWPTHPEHASPKITKTSLARSTMSRQGLERVRGGRECASHVRLGVRERHVHLLRVLDHTALDELCGEGAREGTVSLLERPVIGHRLLREEHVEDHRLAHHLRRQT